MVERAFGSSRFLVLITVAVCTLAALLLYAASVNIVVQTVIAFLGAVPASADSGKRLAVSLLKLVDILLIAVTFQILAVGLYRLFITPETESPSGLLVALQINDFHDLKITLIHVGVVIMVILFLEQAVEVGATLETLFFGGGIALVIVAATWAGNTMRHENTARRD